MAGSEIRFTLDDRLVGAALARLRLHLEDLSPALDEVGNSLATSTRHRFETQQAPDGTPWEPSASGWANTTAEESGKTLVGRGHLRDSNTHLVDGDRLLVGNDLVYGAAHQFGAKIEPKGGSHLVFKVGDAFVKVSSVELPARPYLGIDAADRDEVDQIVEDFIRDGLGGAA